MLAKLWIYFVYVCVIFFHEKFIVLWTLAKKQILANSITNIHFKSSQVKFSLSIHKNQNGKTKLDSIDVTFHRGGGGGGGRGNNIKEA